MTVPTIGELKGNTILELFKNGYNALKNAITGKQNKLIAGDNIVITDDNVISAIPGGEPVLSNYYTKSETNELLSDKADSENVYTKGETEEMIDAVANELPDMTLYYEKTETYSKAQVDAIANSRVKLIVPEVSLNTGSGIKFTEPLKSGDIIVFEPVSSTGNTLPTYVFGYKATNMAWYFVCSITNGEGSTFVKEDIMYRLVLIEGSEPHYNISGMKFITSATNGAVSFSVSLVTGWTANSKVYIYRLEE